MGVNNMAMIILVGGAVLIGASLLMTPKEEDDDDEKERVLADLGNGAPPPTRPVLTGQARTVTTTLGTRSTIAARPDIDMDSEPHMESVQAL